MKIISKSLLLSLVTTSMLLASVPSSTAQLNSSKTALVNEIEALKSSVIRKEKELAYKRYEMVQNRSKYTLADIKSTTATYKQTIFDMKKDIVVKNELLKAKEMEIKVTAAQDNLNEVQKLKTMTEARIAANNEKMLEQERNIQALQAKLEQDSTKEAQKAEIQRGIEIMTNNKRAIAGAGETMYKSTQEVTAKKSRVDSKLSETDATIKSLNQQIIASQGKIVAKNDLIKAMESTIGSKIAEKQGYVAVLDQSLSPAQEQLLTTEKAKLETIVTTATTQYNREIETKRTKKTELQQKVQAATSSRNGSVKTYQESLGVVVKEESNALAVLKFKTDPVTARITSINNELSKKTSSVASAKAGITKLDTEIAALQNTINIHTADRVKEETILKNLEAQKVLKEAELSTLRK